MDNIEYTKLMYEQRIKKLMLIIEQKRTIIYNLSKTLQSLTNTDKEVQDD